MISVPAPKNKMILGLLLTSWLCLLIWLVTFWGHDRLEYQEMAGVLRNVGIAMPFFCFTTGLIGALKADKELQDYFSLPLFISFIIGGFELFRLNGMLSENVNGIPSLMYFIGFAIGGVWYLFSKGGKRDIRKRYWKLVILYGISTAIAFAIAMWIIGTVVAWIIMFLFEV